MTSKKRIFISPLDWGLGHATRCIPIIKELKKQGAEVIIGADNQTFELLVKEFPNTAFIKFPGYNISYSKRGNMLWQMIKMSPRIIGRISIENKYLNEIIKTHKIDGVISDNRYGLYNENVPSIFITHQLNIKSPIAKRIIKFINQLFIKKHFECWVPDYKSKNNSLSGELSHGKNLTNNIQFVGPLSRFNSKNTLTSSEYEVLAIISGPEPQRSIFEEKIIKQLKESNLKSLVVLGKPMGKTTKKEANISFVNHLSSSKMEKAINDSNIVISRPGYTTIMDLATIGKKAIFIPTPGQTEQKYLAKYHAEKEHCVWDKQSTFHLTNLIRESEKIRGFIPIKEVNALEHHVSRFLNEL